MVHEFVKEVVSIYQGAGRPVSIPLEVSFVRRILGSDKARPCFIFGADEIEWIHPKLVSFDVAARLESRREDVIGALGEDKSDTFSAWLGATEEEFLENVIASQPALLLKGIKIKFVYPIGGEEGDPDDDDGYIGTKRWKIRLQRVAV